MRRKSERTASKKTKASPEKKEKVEKVKRTRTRRRKQSTSSSESESTGDNIPKEPVVVSQTEAEVPPKPTKEDSPEESQEQVWHVKATETSGDVGEIQKLKICLARPPSTPERPDRSPRSKRKHSRATSSSDTQSVEGEEKKKSKHRSKRLTESKVEEKAQDNEKIEEESVTQTEASANPEPESTEASVSIEQSKSTADETPMSTTNEETKYDNVESSEGKSEETKPQEESVEDSESQEKPSDADTTVASPKPSDDKEEGNKSPKQERPVRKRSLSEDKSEILEIHAEESRCESSEISLNESQDAKANLDQDKDIVMCNEVSINKSTTEISGKTGSKREDNIKRNKNDVENTKNIDTGTATAVPTESKEENGDNDSGKPIGEKVGKEDIDKINAMDISTENNSEELLQKQVNKEDEICTINSKQDEDKIEKTGHKKSNENLTAKESSSNDLNGETSSDVTTEPITPLVINRKRRWGSRQSKFTTQRSITISTDILKEIIPDVKPTEFEEVIEERKHKKAERQSERIERPVLPKIIIDNTDNVVQNDRKSEERDKENVITRDLNVSSTRKISIVKENDSIIARPPSPPKHKQSNILYITNLVRPFTLPQLKNLLQRTGRIVENGFWIDRIKSKCFVKYENEDQAVETRHALHGVTWPVSNPKTLHVDFSTEEDFDSAKVNEENDNAQTSTIPGTVEDWLREQDLKREKGEMEKPWERKMSMREWDVGKNEKSKDIGRPDKLVRDERPLEKRRHRTPERSPEPARKFKKKEEEAPAKLLDDLFRKTKTTPCIYWLPLSAETIAVKEEQRRQHMAEHERRLQELQRNRPHRRH